MNKQMAVLIMDFGTSKVHANLISLRDASLLYSRSQRIFWTFDSATVRNINPAAIWKASEDAIGSLLSSYDKNAVEIKMMAFSFFGDHVIPVDDCGESLCGLLGCGDLRGDEYLHFITDQISNEDFSRITGSACASFYSPAEIMWVNKAQPDLFKKAKYYYSLQQYILRKLGLEPLNDFNSAGRRMLLDTRKRIWYEKLLDVLQISKEQLGKLAPSATVVGELTSYGDIALPYSLPVILGAHDAACGTLGLGLNPDGSTNLIADSAGTYDLNAIFSHEFRNTYPDENGLMNGCGLDENGYYIQEGAFTGPEMDWFLKYMYDGLDQKSLSTIFNKVIFDGKSTVMFGKVPTSLNGTVVGITPTTTREELFAGLVEAVTYPMKERIEKKYTRLNGKPFDCMRIGSGGAKSDPWVQFKSDLLNMKIERVVNTEISSVGAAIIATVATGIYPNYADAIRNMVNVDQTFLPNPDNAGRCQEKYNAYQRMFN